MVRTLGVSQIFRNRKEWGVCAIFVTNCFENFTEWRSIICFRYVASNAYAIVLFFHFMINASIITQTDKEVKILSGFSLALSIFIL